MTKNKIMEFYFQEFSREQQLIPQEEMFGIRYVFPKTGGRYFIKHLLLEEGIDITFCSLPYDFRFEFQSQRMEEDVLEFCFCVEGKMEIEAQTSQKVFYFSKNQVCLYSSKNEEKGFSFWNQKSKSFSIHIRHSYLQSLFRFGKEDFLEKEWERNIEQMLQKNFLRIWKISPLLQELGKEIFNTSFHSILDYFSLRANVNRFLVKVMLESMNIFDEKEEMLESLRMIIERDYSHRYTLEELSKILHIPVHILQQITKEKKQTTVLQYIRSLKLEYAKYLLEEGKYSITEIASMIGYDNPSKFSTMFYKKYQQQPKKIQGKKY